MPLVVATWNVDGYSTLAHAELLARLVPQCDVVCLQEIKRRAPPADVPGYTWFWNPAAARPHLWGTAILARTSLEPVETERNSTSLADEGRTLSVMMRRTGATVTCVYSPNSGVDRHKPLARLATRLEWDPELHRTADDQPPPCIVCGDLNVAVRDVDVHNPKALRRKAGFTAEERASFRDNLYGDGAGTGADGGPGYTDAWTAVHGADAPGYTFWGRYPGIKEADKGWRLDYQLARGTTPTAAEVLRDVDASDHVPLVVTHRLDAE